MEHSLDGYPNKREKGGTSRKESQNRERELEKTLAQAETQRAVISGLEARVKEVL